MISPPPACHDRSVVSHRFTLTAAGSACKPMPAVWCSEYLNNHHRASAWPSKMCGAAPPQAPRLPRLTADAGHRRLETRPDNPHASNGSGSRARRNFAARGAPEGLISRRSPRSHQLHSSPLPCPTTAEVQEWAQCVARSRGQIAS